MRVNRSRYFPAAKVGTANGAHRSVDRERYMPPCMNERVADGHFPAGLRVQDAARRQYQSHHPQDDASRIDWHLTLRASASSVLCRSLDVIDHQQLALGD